MHTEVRMRPGSHFRASDGPLIERELARLITREDGISAEELLEKTTPKKHPLHPFFYTLTDKEAAHEHRLSEARNMLRSVEIRIIGDEEPKEEDWNRKYVVVVSEGEGRYVPVQSFARNEHKDWLAAIVERAAREWHAYERRYKQYFSLKEFADLLDEIRRLNEEREDIAAD
ncbi:MAG: hypothetical protein LC793_18550 [Thermomicrobia bacterium]|nr:hypothetical protein [Thermomicrobia bacterium]